MNGVVRGSNSARVLLARVGLLGMGAIYLQHGSEFVAMRERPYDAEAVLQALLADHPEILVGGDGDSRGRGWLLVKREAGVADSDDVADRWSLDLLFLDSEGVLTLVEVKRSSGTRARREVVAQMLDYAANATAFWEVESLQAWFFAECGGREIDDADALDEAFGVIDRERYARRSGSRSDSLFRDLAPRPAPAGFLMAIR
jgi:hypothetical protein